MKFRTLTAAALLPALAGLALARPADPRPAEARPLPEAAQPISPPAPAHADQATAHAYLGVEVRPIDPSLADELGLHPGFGLGVRAVGQGTPAELAGLQPGDVLSTLDDQRLVNAEQFAALIGMKQPGDTVTLHLLRDGQAVQEAVQLGERPPRAPRARGQRPDVPQGLMQPPRIAIEPWGDWDMPDPGNLDAFFQQMQERMQQQRREMDQMMQQMRREMRIDLDALQVPRPFDGAFQGIQQNLSIHDGEHAIQLRSDGKTRHLTIKTADGEMLYEGLLPDDGQIQALPAPLQKKIDNLLNNRVWRPAAPKLPAPRPAEEGPIA